MRKGFTLIELLVVISIIGILASIVMVSMSGAAASAKDARVKGAASQVRNLAEIIKDQDGDYDDLCKVASTSLNVVHTTYGSQLAIIQDDVDSNASSGATTDSRSICQDSATTWCYGIYLESGGFWCADHNGVAWATSGTGASAACSSTVSCY